jgi:hypothetical protein
LLRDRQERGGIDVHGPVEVVHGELAGRLENAGCGVGHDDVEPAPFPIDRAEEPLDVLGIGDVAFEDQSLDAASFDLLSRLLSAGAIAEVIDGNVDLEIGQREGNRSTDAARGTGHQGALATEFEIHLHLQGHKLTRESPENKRGKAFSGDFPLTGRGWAANMLSTRKTRRFP